MIRVGRFGNTLVATAAAWGPPAEPRPAARARGAPESQKERRRREDREALGGMRGPRYAVRRLPVLKAAGAQVRRAITRFMDRRPDGGDLVAAFGMMDLGNPDSQIGAAFLRDARALAEELVAELGGDKAIEAAQAHIEMPHKLTHQWGQEKAAAEEETQPSARSPSAR